MNRFTFEVGSPPSPRPLVSPGTSPEERQTEVRSAVRHLGMQISRQLKLGDTGQTCRSALSTLRDNLLVDARLNLANLSVILAELATRARRLQLGQRYRLFAFSRVGLPGADEDDRALSYVVPKPLDCAKAVLADLYAHKYGVHIVPVLALRKHEDYLRCIFRHLAVRPGEPMGVVFRVIHDARYTDVFDFEGHVLPLVIQENSQGVDIVNLNSMGELDYSYAKFLANIHTVHNYLPGVTVRSATVAAQRQADCQSCHTDAMQLLKDSLLAFKRSKQPCFMDYMREGVDEPQYASMPEARFRLPSAFQKTTQRSAALLSDRVDFNVPVEPKGESLQTHREKYMGGFRLGKNVRSSAEDKLSNHFLTIKACRNADRVLAVLEGQTPDEQKRYLNQLRQQW